MRISAHFLGLVCIFTYVYQYIAKKIILQNKMENFEMEWKIEELKKLLKEAWKEKSEYTREVGVLREKVFGLETNIKILMRRL